MVQCGVYNKSQSCLLARESQGEERISLELEQPADLGLHLALTLVLLGK